MTDYIERKRAIEDACNALELYQSEYAELEDALNRIPTADVVEVVRCRECKYHEDTSVIGFGHCCLYGLTMRYNDFCSYGKREGSFDND